MTRRGQRKAVRIYNARWNLFDLEDDIGEKRDLSTRYPDRLREMVSEVEEWSRCHTQPRRFDNLKATREWKAAGMPKYAATFMLPGGRP